MILTDKMIKASRMPQRLPRQRPTAARPQPRPTIDMSKIDNLPNDWSEVCASGLRRHKESNDVPGNESNKSVSPHTAAPKAKKMASNLNPSAAFTKMGIQTDHALGYDFSIVSSKGWIGPEGVSSLSNKRNVSTQITPRSTS